ncbi:retrovirus-related pol polyprotein from transposon TNT 1-94 [Tanacetum coccineum]
MCSYFHSLSDLDAHTELQCLYQHKLKECECLAEKLSKQTETVFKEVYNELLKSFAILEQHSISLEIALQKCQEQMKNDTVCKQNGSTVFLKELEQYFEIQDMKAQLQDKNIAISELKKLIEKMKGNTVDTKFDKPSAVRQPNALRIPKPSVLGKPTPFLDFLERKSFSKTKVIHKTSVSRPQLRSTQMKEKVVHKNSQVKFKKIEVEDHHRISSISNKTKSVTVCNDSLKSRTSNVNVVCATCGKCLNHNLFLAGQFCDADLEVAFWKSTCFVRDLQGNDLLTGNRGSDLYTISLQVSSSPTPINFLAKTSPTQAWLWHQRLSHLNFDTINLFSKKDIVNGLPKLKYVKDQLCSSCELDKAKKSTFKTKIVPSLKGRLYFLHMDICGPMWIESINGKKYILVIVDDYSRYTWTLFLRTKDETPEVLKDFLKMIQRNLQAQVITVRTNIGTKFLNKTLHAYFKEKDIEHQTSTPRTPEQNDIVERRNRTLVKVARTMLSASKLPLFFWAEAIATACYTQNRSRIIPRHEHIPYHIINGRKPSLKHLHIFGCTCYITRDGENLNKMKEKEDPCILELSKASDYDNSGPEPQLQKTSDHNRSELGNQDHSNEPSSSTLALNVSPLVDINAPSLQELEFLLSPSFEQYFTAGNQSVSKSLALSDNSKKQDTQPITNIQPTT